MSKKINKEDILAIECRFAVYCPSNDRSPNDVHAIKEVIHLKDGTTQNNLRLVANYKRPFWITKKGCQNHEQKKEWEDIERVNLYSTPQHELIKSVSRAIGEPWFTGNLRKLNRNPFIYGTDILSTAIIKRSYMDKYPANVTKYTMAAFDVETDVVRGTEEITMATLSFGKKVITAVQKSAVAGYANVIVRLHELMDKYLSEYISKRGIEWEVVLVDKEVEVITKCFERAHQWKPDFVAIWNIAFDMPKMITALEKAGVHPKNVFSDPSVPSNFRHFNFKLGPNKKVTASGLVTPIKPAAQWHTTYCPSSFYFIDAMCAYKHIRTGSQEEPSYALDNILNKHLGIRKLKFKEAEGLTGIDWHQFMQSKYPLEYVIYNVFDCVAMEELDEVTLDLSLTLPLFSGCSDFDNFKSQPRRLADNLHYFSIDNKRVIGSTSDEMATELDSSVIGLDGWIITLPAHLITENGLCNVIENKHLRTNIRTHVAD